ncbi:MAG: hypothetical protein FJZ56_03710 [Chlamydiae bacterium]|nr:hypothetical protein [Chlamydiota bacterium]
MKRNILIIFSLCILCSACGGKSPTYTTSVVSKERSSAECPNDHATYLSYEDRDVLARVSLKTLDKIKKGSALDTSDVIQMQRSGIQPDTMIQVLLFTHSKFTLTTSEIIQLQSEGVSFKVINFMIRT